MPPTTTSVLVTGAGGFLGTPVCDLLAERGVTVHAITRGPARRRQERNSRGSVLWHQADLLDPAAARTLVLDLRPTHLLHLAWATGADGFRDSPENFRWIGPSLELLRAFHEAGGRRVVGVGTGAEYDWHSADVSSEGRCSEDTTPLRPALTYGLCKRTFSELFERFLAATPASGAWARLFFLYGPGEESRRLVASLALDLLRGQPARCNYDRLERDYLFVDDAAEGLVRLLFSDVEGPINLASGQAPPLGHWARALAEQVGRPDAVVLGGLPPDPLSSEGGQPAEGPPRRVVASIDRARRELGWQPRWSEADALARTLDWWRGRLAAGETP